MAATIQAYKDCAEQWRHIGSLVQQASRDTDMLRIPIPQRLAFGMADLLTFPEDILKLAKARQAAGWSSIWDAIDEERRDKGAGS